MNAYWDDGVLLVDCKGCGMVHTPTECGLDRGVERDHLHKVIEKVETLLRNTRLAWEKEEVYRDRSPINHLEKLKAPMIILQGSEDQVVNPDVSREMADILKERCVMHEYVEYEGEAHGFRSKANLVDSLQREASFYRKVLFAEDT